MLPRLTALSIRRKFSRACRFDSLIDKGLASRARAWLASRTGDCHIEMSWCTVAADFRIYLLQTILIATLGVARTVVAAIAPLFAIKALSEYVTVPLTATIYLYRWRLPPALDC